jgi:very-short-patch-repair endonuclease
MKGQTNRSIIDNGLQRKLRGDMTDAEKRLWQRLRGRQMAGFKFRRQHPFMDFVLDFVCLETRLVVEVDGSQHQDNLRDRARDQRLHEAGFRVLRFWNNQVLEETDAVADAIWAALHAEALHVESDGIYPSPSRPPP